MSLPTSASGAVCASCGAYFRQPVPGPCRRCGAAGHRSGRLGVWLLGGAGILALVAAFLLAPGLSQALRPGSSEVREFAGTKGAPAIQGSEIVVSDPRPPRLSDGNKPPREVPKERAPVSPAESRNSASAKLDAIEWANLGAAEASQGRFTEAEAAYRKALDLEPENWLAHYNLGLLELRRGRNEEAFSHWERSLGSLDRRDRNLAGKVRQQLAKEPACAGLIGEERFHALVRTR